MSGNCAENIRRAQAYVNYMQGLKDNLPPSENREQRYEALRERYANGSIDLEDFTAAVVTLLKEGL